MGNGLYGQNQGNEKRSSSEVIVDRFEENQQIEGEHVKKLRQLISTHKWPEVEKYIQKLKDLHFSQDRIQSITTQAQALARI